MRIATHARTVWSRSAMFAALCATCVVLASCISTAVATGTPPLSPTGQSATVTTATSDAGSLKAGYDQNGQTISLHLGQTLTVTLPQTTWTFQASSNPRVLSQVGGEGVTPVPFNPTTCPFGGCGTVTAVFRALAPGTARIMALRSSCGEAAGCTGATGTYQLTVVVTA